MTRQENKQMNRKTKFVGIITAVSLLVVMLALVLQPMPVGAAGGVETVIDYSVYNPPLFPEGLAIDKKGNIYVSIAEQAEIRRITPDGTESILTTLPAGGFGLLGLAVDAPGNIYAALASANPATGGVYRVSRDGVSERLPGSEAILVPNALVFDKQGNLYVTDTILGAVWLIPRGGQAELWLQDELLEGTGVLLGGNTPIGANGIAYRQGTLYVANTEKGTIVRIPVNSDGSPGTPDVLTDGIFGVDGLALDVLDNIYAVSVTDDKLVRVNLADTSLTVLVENDGLDGPASLAFGTGKGARKYVFIANFALFSGANPGVVKFDVGVLGLPLP
jgi:sugar lactone lactonase YvrE